jgi:hypothetical protein
MNHERHRSNLRRFNQQRSSQSRAVTGLILLAPAHLQPNSLHPCSGPWRRICMSGPQPRRLKSSPSNFSVLVWALPSVGARLFPSARFFSDRLDIIFCLLQRQVIRGRKPSAALDKNNGDGGCTITATMIPHRLLLRPRGFWPVSAFP